MKHFAYRGEYFSIGIDSRGVEFVATGDGTLIVPMANPSEIILIEEPAPAFDGALTYVLPGGELEPVEAPLETANRELQEEIGYRAGRLDYLGELRPFAKYLQSRQIVYLARDLTPSHLDGDEDFLIRAVSFNLGQIEAWVASGRLQDSSTIAALFLARSYIHAEP